MQSLFKLFQQRKIQVKTYKPKINICSNCHVALMYSHPTLHNWEKCILCGACQKCEPAKKEEITNNEPRRNTKK